MPLTAVILAAGAGTRLGALGKQASKPTLPVAGRPLITWIFDMLAGAGVERFVVVGHPSDERLAGLVHSLDNATLVLQSERRGIANALRCALPEVADEAAYLACAGDSLYRAAEVRALIAIGREAPGAAVVGVLDMGVAATASRSAVRVVDQRIVEIVEKPPAGTFDSGLVALPLYWLPAAFARHTSDAGVPGESYISTALDRFVRAGGTIIASHMSKRLEITTPADLVQVEHTLSSTSHWIDGA